MNGKKQRVTIKDIARAAEVDPSTVTRALQGSQRVRPTTREKVTRIASEMGYVPNMAARTLVQAKSGLIGVVVPDMTNPFFRDLGQGIEDEAALNGWRVVFNDTRGDVVAERDAVELLIALKVDGLIIPMARSPQSYFDTLALTLGDSLPLVHVNREEAPHNVSCEQIDGTAWAIRHLIEWGHERIGFVRGPRIPGGDPKFDAYLQVLLENELQLETQYLFDFDGGLDSSAAIVAQLLSLQTRPTALFAHNDLNAIAMIHHLREAGFGVPKDISIVGHDNIQASGYNHPTITTVSWPMYELGQQSVRYLRCLHEGGHYHAADLPAPSLVVRASTGAPR